MTTLVHEVDFLFDSNSAGIRIYTNQEAIQNRLENWISTPRGTFWGRPNYGHTLRKFLHEPPTETLAMSIESELADTLIDDLPEVEIQWLRVKPNEEFDGYYLKIGYKTDDFTGSAELKL